MLEPDLFLAFVRPLNQLGIRYMIGGSVATMFYGEPRLTHDVDVIVFLNERDVRRLAEGFPASEFYVPPAETILQEILREQRGHFNLIHLDSAFKADMFLVGRDELSAWGFRHKKVIQYEGESLVLAPPEYVIVRKLEYYQDGRSEKHLRDIRSMLSVSDSQMDQPALQDWIQQRGLEKEWREVLGK